MPSLVPGARRAHKGSKNANKPSVKRREAMFGSQNTADRSDGAARFESSAAEIQERLAWVC